GRLGERLRLARLRHMARIGIEDDPEPVEARVILRHFREKRIDVVSALANRLGLRLEPVPDHALLGEALIRRINHRKRRRRP
ncbi:MAG TPA: hypothetical protein VFQ80_14525, partial [Thermomicrobiales bacterium]|nr:hypothetical protein [Thermomicrobiales bacterium]